MDAKQRAEYKRRRTVAIKRLRETGLSEEEIQEELAKIREGLGTARSEDPVIESDNLPAVIDSADRHGRARGENRQYPQKPGRDERGNSTNKEAVAQYDSVLAQNAERQCAATNVKGERCRRYAIAGGTVCKTHGGATRHIRNKARIRVEMASDRLVTKLIDIAFDDTRPAAVQLDAIQDALNRAGLTKPAQVEVGPIKPFEEVFADIGSGTREESRARRGPGDSALDFLNSQADSADSSSAGMYPDTGFDDGRDSRPRDPREHGDYDRPAAPQTRERTRQGDRYRRHHITGEEAIKMANEANAAIGALRALPPGRSS